MEHFVRFQTPEGREGHHSAETLEDALRFVERLRNSEDASHVRVFRMTEVPIEFRTYYKVELRTDSENASALSAPEPETPVGVVGGDEQGDNGRRLFARG